MPASSQSFRRQAIEAPGLVLLLLAVTVVAGCERTGRGAADERPPRTDTTPAGFDLQSAARRYRQALEHDPDRADTHLELAWVLEELGDLGAAADHCDRALELDPAAAGAWHLRGRLLERAGDDNAAVAAYEAALGHAPHAVQPRELLAGALMRLGRYDAARRHYAECLTRADAAPARILYRYGLALVASGRCAPALDPLQRAYAADPSSAETAETLIRVQSACPAGETRAAGVPMALAAELFRARPEAGVAEALAMAHAAQGDFDNAVLLQRRVVSSGQGDSYSRDLLGHFERSEPAPHPFGPDARAFRVPRLGSR